LIISPKVHKYLKNCVIQKRCHTNIILVVKGIKNYSNIYTLLVLIMWKDSSDLPTVFRDVREDFNREKNENERNKLL